MSPRVTASRHRLACSQARHHCASPATQVPALRFTPWGEDYLRARDGVDPGSGRLPSQALPASPVTTLMPTGERTALSIHRRSRRCPACAIRIREPSFGVPARATDPRRAGCQASTVAVWAGCALVWTRLHALAVVRAMAPGAHRASRAAGNALSNPSRWLVGPLRGPPIGRAWAGQPIARLVAFAVAERARDRARLVRARPVC